MDLSDSTTVVFNRIQQIEPENVSKIIGYIMLQDLGEREMIRLAFSPDNLILSLINKAKIDLEMLGLSAPISPSQVTVPPTPVTDHIPLQFTPFSPAAFARPLSSPSGLRAGTAFLDRRLSPGDHQIPEFVHPGYSDTITEDFHLQNQMQFLSLDDQLESTNFPNPDRSSNYYHPKPALGPRTSRRSPSMPDFPFKICYYFNKGFCKHGNNCRYFHGHPMPESFSQNNSQSSIAPSSDDHVFSPGSLEKLDLEITGLLRSKRGSPISIASLPMMYAEKYGRSLQAEGYLTESQRHGKAGYSLTKLLARLKGIKLIERLHGQHSVILAEDFLNYLEHASGERSGSGGMIAGAQQIYLTFPADSTFTEQDVANYFNKFGPVQDVRIPCQHNRTYGFVTFVFSESVEEILSKGNPNFICGDRVLVKPYKEKPRLVDRKYNEKIHHPKHYSQLFLDGDSIVGNPMFLRQQQLIEERQHALEQDRMRFSELQLAARKHFCHHSHFGYPMVDQSKLPEANANFPSAERFNYLLSSEETIRDINSKYIDQDRCNSQGLQLPESPFALA